MPTACRSTFSGARLVAKHFNLVGGNLITPLTTVFSWARQYYFTDRAAYSNDEVQKRVRNCFALAPTVDLLKFDNSTDQDPLRAFATGSDASNATKRHLFTILGIGNGLQMLNGLLEETIPLGKWTTADERQTEVYRRKARASDALIDGITRRCFDRTSFLLTSETHVRLSVIMSTYNGSLSLFLCV